MTITLDADMMARIEAAIIQSGKEVTKPILISSTKTAEMLGIQKRALKRTGLKPIQIPGQRDKYVISEVLALIEYCRVK